MLVHPTLLVAAASVAGVAAAYTYVGVRLARRKDLQGESRVALQLFALWWWTTAANMLGGSAIYVAAAFGHTDFPLQLTYALMSRLLLAVSMVGLMGYMLYLFTGRIRLVPIAIFYGGFYVLLITMLTLGAPDGVDVARWRTDISYTTPSPTWMRLVQFAALVLPPVLAGLAYLRLLFRVKSPEQKYRIVLVSTSLIIWWILAVVAGQRGAYDSDVLQVVNRLVGLAAGAAILLAYEPPAWVRRRWTHAAPAEAAA